MNVKLIGSPKIVMTNTENHHAYFAWPTIAKLQNGKICVGASGYRVEHICPFGKGVLAFSDDNGETWSKESIIFEGQDTDDLGYPSTVELDNGELLTVFYTRENDYVPAVIMQQKWSLVK